MTLFVLFTMGEFIYNCSGFLDTLNSSISVRVTYTTYSKYSIVGWQPLLNGFSVQNASASIHPFFLSLPFSRACRSHIYFNVSQTQQFLPNDTRNLYFHSLILYEHSQVLFSDAV